MLFRRSYLFIIINKTINKTPSKIMFRVTVSAATVLNRVSNFGQVINRLGKIAEFGKGFGKRAAHPHPLVLGIPLTLRLPRNTT